MKQVNARFENKKANEPTAKHMVHFANTMEAKIYYTMTMREYYKLAVDKEHKYVAAFIWHSHLRRYTHDNTQVKSEISVCKMF